MADPSADIGGMSLFQKKHLRLSDRNLKKKMLAKVSSSSEIGETKPKLKKKERKNFMDTEGGYASNDIFEQRKKKKKKKIKGKVDVDFSDLVGNVKGDPSEWTPRNASTDDVTLRMSQELKGKKRTEGFVDIKTHKHGSDRLGQVISVHTDSVRRSASFEEKESDRKVKANERTNKGLKRKRHREEGESGTVKYKMKRKRKNVGADDSDSSEEDGSRDEVADTPEGHGWLSLAKDDSNNEQNSSEEENDAEEHAGSVDKPETWTSSRDESDSDEDDTSEKEEEQKEEGKSEEDEYAVIKQELSNMSFEDLQKIQEKLGMKVFNQLRHGGKVDERKKKRLFKRENKNRPMEISSKRPVGIVRSTGHPKKKMSRDPRFDDLSGQYNETYFKKSYSFLDEVKAREKEKVKKQVKKEKDPDKKKDLQYLLNRMNQQDTSKEQKERRQAMDKEFKQREKDLVKEGKTPFFLKKADKRKLELAEKFKELKKSGKVDKYLMKKRKKNAQKDRRKMPAKFDRYDI